MNDLAQFCASFWPTGGYTQLIMALLVSATLINIRYWNLNHVTVAGVMWLSWVGARTATEQSAPLVAAVICFFCIIGLSFLKSSPAKLIATAYLPRVVILSLGHLSVVPVFIMWEINNLFVILQIAILAGGADGGILSRLDSVWANLRRYVLVHSGRTKALARRVLGSSPPDFPSSPGG